MADVFPHTHSGFWARQILSEFENICWQYTVNLVPPVVEITDNTSRIGSWQAGTRTIRISSELIAGYPWDTTINVLKHEIAHQICSEVLDHDSSSVHGKQFHKACDMIGLPPEFRKSNGNIESFNRVMTSNRQNSRAERMIEKVRKLMALAGSSNGHEATLAMQKANDVIRRHNLDMLESDRDRDYTYSVISLHKKQIKTYQRQICAILTDFFFVQVITSSTYDPLKNNAFRTIELLGTPENVVIAEHCYYFLENRLKTLWEKKKHHFTSNTRTEKNSFYMGILKGFNKKLSKEKIVWERSSSGSKNGRDIRSLMITGDKKLNTYVSKRFPRLRSVSGRGTRIYKSTFNDGIKAGKDITLHKAVTSQDGYLGNLITDPA